MSSKKCKAGCNCFKGGEVRHHRTCENYPDSLTEMYDLAIAKINYLEDNIARLNKEADENQIRIKELYSELGKRDKSINHLTENNQEHEKHLTLQEDKIVSLTNRLDKSHSAHGTALETIDSLRDDIARLKDIIKRKNEVIQLIVRDLE